MNAGPRTSAIKAVSDVAKANPLIALFVIFGLAVVAIQGTIVIRIWQLNEAAITSQRTEFLKFIQDDIRGMHEHD